MRLTLYNNKEVTIRELYRQVRCLADSDPIAVMQKNPKIARQLIKSRIDLRENSINERIWPDVLEKLFFSELVGPHDFLLDVFPEFSVFRPEECFLCNHKLLSVAGHGTDACVFKTADDFCLKVGPVYKKEKFLKEYHILQAVRHDNIVKSYDFYETPEIVAILMEPIQSVWGMEEGYLKGLAHCHSKGFLHGDIRLKNLGIDSDGNSKLFDFGNADPISSPEETKRETERLRDVISSLVFIK